MTLVVEAVDGIGEIRPGDDLAAIVAAATTLADGDVVVVTSKVVSKAAGLVTTTDRDSLLAEQTDRVVATRGETRIVRTHHGLTMAAAGIDASNTQAGTFVTLPPDPDASAREIRARLHELTGARVGVVVSDTAGRAWRVGQTDVAIGCAGLLPVESFAGRVDAHGNPLVVTAPAIADQVAGAAELASGKLGGRPVVVVRGLPTAWLTVGDGPGAVALIRPEDEDLFGLGARDAVLAALAADGPVRGFAATGVTVADVVALAHDGDETPIVTVDGATVTIVVSGGSADLVAAGRLEQRLTALAAAHGVELVTELHVDG